MEANFEYNDNLTFTNYFCTLGSNVVVNVCIACTLQCKQYIDWLSQDNWMDWACSLRRTLLHPTPLDNHSVTCTHFAQQNQDWSIHVFVVCVCVLL